MNRGQALLAAAAAVMSILSMAPANAVPITPSPTIVNHNMLFDDFTCSSVNVPSCDDISVSPHVSVSPPDATTGDYGIMIQGAFLAPPGSSGDVIITYHAHITGAFFHDASMFYNGTPISSVSEQVYDLDTSQLIGTLLVTDPPPVFTDYTVLAHNAKNLLFVKDIGYVAPVNGQVHISKVDEDDSQISVPEPGSLALLGAALAGFGILTRRRTT